MVRNSWKVEALKRAKLEAEKGEFISHEAMGAWINSPGTDEELPVPEIDVFKNPFELINFWNEFEQFRRDDEASYIHAIQVNKYCYPILSINIQ